MIMNWK